MSSYGPCGTSADALPSNKWLGVRGRKSLGSSDKQVKGRLLTMDLTSANIVAFSFQERICSPVLMRKARFVTLIKLSYIPPW